MTIHQSRLSQETYFTIVIFIGIGISVSTYRVSILNQFVQWPATSNERNESLEQLRALDNGVTIHCQEAIANVPAGVDTLDDLVKVRTLLQ